MRRVMIGWAVAIAAVFAACSLLDDNGTTVIVSQNQGQTGGSDPTASPSPGTSPTGAVTSVRVSVFGAETCSTGTPNPALGIVGVGCQQAVTCTPLLANGDEAPPGVHPPAPDSFAVTEGAAIDLRLHEDGNPYNREAVGLAVGTSKIRCAVGNATPGELELSVE